MASKYSQANRPMAVSTPLPMDTLLLISISGQEGLSHLFNFQLTMVAATKTKIAFEDLLGKPITVRLGSVDANKRFINGICIRMAQGGSDLDFTTYMMDVVPKTWLLSKRARSRIFQGLSVPDILKKVLDGIDVAWEIQGTFEPRDFCVQYRETDYNFAERLMEEEGIYYYYRHTDGGHKLVLANTSASHSAIPGGAGVVWHSSSAGAEVGRITEWVKRQEIHSSLVTLRDHHFELAHKPLEAVKKIKPDVKAGTVTHLLTAGNAGLELYDWPGEYAQRFDGVDPGGGDRAADLQKITKDNERTAAIRMDQEALPTVLVQGAGDCLRLTAGHQFSLTLAAGDNVGKLMGAEGKYVLTSVNHIASQGNYLSAKGAVDFRYQNSFTAIPFDMPYRPARDTPKPFVQGLQTAVVVGQPGQEIFTDKYGRVKVQFHWERDPKSDATSSCWVRVAQVIAGKRWGASFWPRVGQEVIVAFQEGDPDQPIIIGSVYNSDQMPPYLGDGLDSKHPKDNKISGIKTNTTLGGEGFNEWRFDDTKGKEQIFFHAERNMDTRVKHDSIERVIHDRSLIVGWEKDGQKGGDQKEKVYQDKHLHVLRDQEEQIDGNLNLMVGNGGADNGGEVDIVIQKGKYELIGEQSHLHVTKEVFNGFDSDFCQTVGGNKHENIVGQCNLVVKKELFEKVGTDHSLTVGGKLQQKITGNLGVEAAEIHLKTTTKIILEATSQISLVVGGNFIDISSAGINIVGMKVGINSGGAGGSGSGCSPGTPTDAVKPDDADKAKPVDPAVADDSKSGAKSAPK
jgi:type VI secretion system secreted protein VgrG